MFSSWTSRLIRQKEAVGACSLIESGTLGADYQFLITSRTSLFSRITTFRKRHNLPSYHDFLSNFPEKSITLSYRVSYFKSTDFAVKITILLLLDLLSTVSNLKRRNRNVFATF